jgi:hypothetical protein
VQDVQDQTGTVWACRIKQTVGQRVRRLCVGVGVQDAGQDLQPCLLLARLCCGTVAQFFSGRYLPGDSCTSADQETAVQHSTVGRC